MNSDVKVGQITWKALVLTSVVISLLFYWQGAKGFSLWDEGFLWYGAQRVMLGEVPIRDFMAYDPGRYYWSSTLMSLIGSNGIMSLRAAVALFQALGLFAAMLLVGHSAKEDGRANHVFWLICASTFAVWMFPRHKLFDISLSIFLISILTYLVKNPVSKRYFIAGVLVGLIAVFGRNHGMYGAAGSIGVVLWLSAKRLSKIPLIKATFLWGTGVVTGFMPILLMAVAIDGFSVSFWESIRFLFEYKGTNLPLPVPWPWKANYADMAVGEGVRHLLVGLFFIGIIAFGALGIAWLFLKKERLADVPPALVAAAFLALPYAHFAFSRADVGHLAQAIFPMLVGCLVILSRQGRTIKWLSTIVLCTASFWTMLVLHPGWQCRGNRCVDVTISGSTLQVDPATASDIMLLRQMAAQFGEKGRSFIVTPLWPGAYPLLEQRSPMWEIYALFPRPETFEMKEIERIKASRPSFALIYDLPLDTREELRFRNTHPLLHRYILDNFDEVPNSRNPAYQLYKAKDLRK